MNYWPADSYRIFISYAREDALDVALRLRGDLAAAGHDAWLDLAEIAAGASWARDIEEAIEGCDLALTLLSSGAYISDICRAEQLRALRKGKRVIPVLVQPDADRPLHLEHLNYVDFSDSARYSDLFPDLLAYILTGQMPASLTPSPPNTPTEAPFPPPEQPRVYSGERKRDARAFRRYLDDLRSEPWLGARHWWTYFLFYYADVHDVAQILQTGIIQPPAQRKRWDRTVRLNFRPRTPDLFGCEGIRPAGERPTNHCAVPVYLLFDLEALITMPDSRFSEGDLSLSSRTFKAASAFRDLPFDLIYHDSWLRKEERDEILNARRAQVIMPDALPLDHLKHVLCRSAAECETLLTLLPKEIRRAWRERIAAKPEYNLFNNKWTYVKAAALSPEGAHFQFNPCDNTNGDECVAFDVRAEIETADGEHHSIELAEITLRDDLALDFTALLLAAPYRLHLYLDDALAYVGECVG